MDTAPILFLISVFLLSLAEKNPAFWKTNRQFSYEILTRNERKWFPPPVPSGREPLRILVNTVEKQ
ncbi:MAG: hypothetical protein HFE97_00605 [Oscillospiraceae bacterium]|nr:hypothetical protein [Oscillospiraceae bacterium]